MSPGVLTWGSVGVAVAGLVMNWWGRLGAEGERAVARHVGMLIAITFTCSAFFFAVQS